MIARRTVTAALALVLASALGGCKDDPPSSAVATADAGTTDDAGGSGGAGGGPSGARCEGAGIGKGPWSLAIGDTTAEVRWEACRPGTTPGLVVRPEQGGAEQQVPSTETATEVTLAAIAPLLQEAPPDEAGTFYMHTAKLTGLTPATCYAYHLAADPDLAGRFCTARAPGDPFRFMAVGDTNPGLGDNTKKLLALAVPEQPDFTIHAGDIQYYASGLETWASWFPAMQPMLSMGAFQPTIGNHELEKPGELEQYYARFFGGAGTRGELRRYAFQTGGVWFFALDTELPIAPGEAQVTWLESELAEAAASPGYRFSVVWLHRPLVTCGDTSDDTSGRETLEPLFDKYAVRLVVQGHMHGYERFELGDVTYITAGGGGGALGDTDENADRPECAQRIASGAFHNVVLFDVAPGELRGRAIDPDGKERDAFTKVVP